MHKSLIIHIIILVIFVSSFLFFFFPKNSHSEANLDDNKSVVVETIKDNFECLTDNDCLDNYNEYFSCEKNECICHVPAVRDLVCGVDGITYLNPSEAQCKDIEIESYEACDGSFCGDGICQGGEFIYECPDDEFSDAPCVLVGTRCPQDCPNLSNSDGDLGA